MPRIARMPHVYHGKAKGRHFVEKRVPPDVHAIIGGKAKRKHTFPKSVDEATANRLALAILDGWEQEWDAARPIQLVPVRFSRPRPPGIVLDAIMMEGMAGISRDELMRRLVNAYRPRMIRLPLAIGVFDDNAHALAAVLVVGVTEHADARPLHFDNCRDALAIAEPQHRHLGLTRDGVAIQRHHLEYMLRQSEAADFLALALRTCTSNRSPVLTRIGCNS
jgi:hypothetical protein